MFILLYGPDTFRSRRKLNELIERYKTIHKSGLNLVRWLSVEFDFDFFKQTIESVSMFQEKKLIVLENVFDQACPNNRSYSDGYRVLEYLKTRKEGEEIIIFFEEGNLDKKILKEFGEKPNLSQEFQFLTGVKLCNWARREIKECGGRIEEIALRRLIDFVGNNLWLLDNEINKLLAYADSKIIKSGDVDLLVKNRIETKIFRTIDAIAQQNKNLAGRLIQEHLYQGENELYLLTMIIYQFRNLIQVKDLTLKNAPFPDLIKKTGIHPFVLRKSFEQAKSFSQEELKRIYQDLLETDQSIKTGRIEPRTALEMLVMEI